MLYLMKYFLPTSEMYRLIISFLPLYIYIFTCIHRNMPTLPRGNIHTHTHGKRQADIRTDRQADKHSVRQADRQTDRHTHAQTQQIRALIQVAYIYTYVAGTADIYVDTHPDLHVHTHMPIRMFLWRCNQTSRHVCMPAYLHIHNCTSMFAI